MILSDDEARAAQEVAKATGKAIDAATGAGTVLVNGTVGRIAAATLRLVGGDWVEEQQKRNLARMQAKTARILDGNDQARLSAPSPSVVRPLLEAAADESREELQDLWAALLANAMLDGGKRVRRDYFEVVKQMEPVDAWFLDLIARRPNAHTSDNTAQNADRSFIEAERARLSVHPDDLMIAQQKLVKLECIALDIVPRLTVFGRALVAACRVS